MKRRFKTVLFWIWVLLFLSGLVVTILFLKEYGLQQSALLLRNFLGDNSVSVLFSLLILYLVRSIVFVPVSILGTLTGMVLPDHKLLAIVFACSATILSALFSFSIARALGRSWVARHETPRLRRFEEKVRARGFFTIFILRILVFIPFDLINLASGFSVVRWRDFALATALGIIPEVTLQVLVGNSLVNFLGKTFLQPQNFIFFALILIGLSVAGYFMKTHPHFRDLITSAVKKTTRPKKAFAFAKARKILLKFSLILLNTLR